MRRFAACFRNAGHVRSPRLKRAKIAVVSTRPPADRKREAHLPHCSDEGRESAASDLRRIRLPERHERSNAPLRMGAKLFFPGFVHDVVWNHALCTIKEGVERLHDRPLPT